MKIVKPAKAGTMESNDIYVMVMPNEDGKIELELESIVMKQFGCEIEKVIRETLKDLDVTSATIKAQDKGALNYTIRARIETAVKRASM
ncbi:citrate lyase subunit gamma (acyl carrier protein) [Hathewaya proteolytica DSM 3090]|uniref:Citrate lyase subunit gamma (Acyl carrier protein) n=1 Tax=Hathewaya proteolytica DSM 3090 TaxID=1121331 RepID=A0A1M6PXC9_9CLOT|nr:citrate lyase acyl carrier protein [Hathewaya proteolytica]SHK12557.1 citrate lyase subunit gamma (acyl carrier protein) [Hathewaya proteolytica DSM 3090]